MQEEKYTIPEMVDDVRAGKMPRRQFMKTLAAMGISAAGVGAIAAAAAARSFNSAAVAHDKLDKSANLEQLHQQHLAHQSQGDTDALQNDYALHAVVEDSMYSQPFVGHEAIMGRKAVGMAAFPGVQIHVTNRVVHGDQVTVEWIAKGTHTNDFPGLAATGRDFSIPGVTVVVRQNGKIVRESLYYDMAEVQRQLGSPREL